MINNKNLRLLGFADNLDVIEKSLEDIGNVEKLLKMEARNFRLQINSDKTKLMEFINSWVDIAESEELIFEKVNDFKYLNKTLSTKNDLSKEIYIRLNKAEKLSTY